MSAQDEGNAGGASSSREVSIPSGLDEVDATWTVPAGARGVVVFAHGSGSSRFSSRNRFVAHVLEDAGFATLLLDLLTPVEETHDRVTAEHRFDVDLLAERLGDAIAWVRAQRESAVLPIGLFGASTGAAAALIAAGMAPSDVDAVVSRGGRPDLAGAALRQVRAPTLLIVGGHDAVVLGLNESALAWMGEDVGDLVVVPGATHLFEEPGALEHVAAHARDWFARYLRADRAMAATTTGEASDDEMRG